jgi:hypothetical protein
MSPFGKTKEMGLIREPGNLPVMCKELQGVRINDDKTSPRASFLFVMLLNFEH